MERGVPAIKKEKAYLRIVDVVIRMIAEGKVEYQDRFYTEQELMTMLGVSRPTLREALRVLEFLGGDQCIAQKRHFHPKTVRSGGLSAAAVYPGL